MTLNNKERDSYQKNFLKRIPNLPAGIYQISDFFGTEPSVPRISRKFYEDVTAGLFPNVALYNNKSSEGYVIT